MGDTMTQLKEKLGDRLEPVSTAALSPTDFRNVMANLPSAVSIVTSDGPAGRCGITASSVCAVSDRPPTILVCINRNCRSSRIYRENGLIAVSALTQEQGYLAERFGGADSIDQSERFCQGVWHRDRDGLPLLEDALVTLSGAIQETVEVATHTVFFVNIRNAWAGESKPPAIYFRRSIRRLSQRQIA
jgi:flavin reductase (NADH)